MKPDYIKIAAIIVSITFVSFLAYGIYGVSKKLSEQSKSKVNLKNKKFSLATIIDDQGQVIDTNYFNNQTKMVVYLSVRCPHCLNFLKAFNSNTTFPKDKIIPIFRVDSAAIDSFSKVNNLSSLKLYHVNNNGINNLVKSVPTFLVIDENNRIKKIHGGIPRFENNDSLMTFVNSLFSKDDTVKNNLPTESCH